MVNSSKPVILEEYQLSDSTNHLVYQQKIEANEAKKGIKALLDSERTKGNELIKRSFRLKPMRSNSTNTTRHLIGKKSVCRIFMK